MDRPKSPYPPKSDRDPFWDNEARTEAAKKPTNGWDALQTVVFWLAICFFLWLFFGHPGVNCG